MAETVYASVRMEDPQQPYVIELGDKKVMLYYSEAESHDKQYFIRSYANFLDIKLIRMDYIAYR